MQIAALKARIDARLNDHLCEMQPDYDDSITGFNEAWDIVRRIFDEITQTIDPAAKKRAGISEQKSDRKIPGVTLQALRGGDGVPR